MAVPIRGIKWITLIILISLLGCVQAQKKKAGPPLNVRELSVTSSSITVGWNPPKKVPKATSVSGFKLLFRLQGSSGQKKVDIPNVSEYIISDLAAGSVYEVKMATITSNGKVGGFSSWQRMTTDQEQTQPPPNPPQNVRAQVEGTTITMEWTPPQGSFDGYVVSYGVNSADENTLDVSQEDLGATLSGLQAGSSYQLQLQSVRGGVRSQPLELSLQTGVPVPSPPGTIRLRSTSDSIDVEWSHDSVSQEGVSGFALSVGPESNPTEQTFDMTSSDRFTTVSGLQPGQVYIVSLKALNQYGESQPISDKISTQAALPTGPSPPTGMQMRASTDSIEVYWGEPSGGDMEYILDVGTAGNPTQFSQRFPRGTSNHRVDNLAPDTEYLVSIRSVDSSGESQPIQQTIRTQEAQGPMPPSGMRMSARSDAIDVIWGAASGSIDGYRLDVGPQSDPNQFSQTFPPGTTSHTVSGLEPNTEYQVSVVSVSGNRDSQPLKQVIRTTNIAPPSSINLRASADTIEVQWPAAQDSVDGYNLQVAAGGNVVYKETLTPVDVSHTVTGLNPGTDYAVSLTSFKGDATSPPIQQNIRTIAGPSPPVDSGLPDAPTGVQVTTEGGNLRVSWSPVQGATGYVVRAGEALSGATDDVEERLNSRKSQYLIRNLTPDADYLVSVSSVNDAGESRPTMVTARTQSPLPGQPEGFAADTTSDTATLTWRAPATPIDGYTLSLGTVTYPGQFTETLGPRDTTFTFRDIQPDTIYQAELQSFNSVGNSQPVTAKVRTDPAPVVVAPDAPDRLDLSSTQSRVNIRWSPARGAIDGYRIMITETDTGESNMVELDKFQQSYAFTDLEPGTDYEVSIQAFTGDGFSTPQVQTVSTVDLPAGSDLPQNVDIVATGTQIDAHWNPPTLRTDQNLHSYVLVAQAIDNNGPLGPRESITLHHSQNEHTFYGLLPATKYSVSVAANIDGTLTAPVVNEVITTIDGPIPPINVQAEPISPNSITVSWDFPVETGPPGSSSGGQRPDIYYTVRASNPEAGEVYGNSREMSLSVENLRPDTLYEVQVAMVFNGRISDYGETFAVRTFSDVDPRSPQFPTVTQVLLENPETVHATFNWLPPREGADDIRSYSLEYTTAEDPSLDNTTWDSASGGANDMGVVVSNLPTNSIVTYRVQPLYSGGTQGPFSPLAAFSTPVAERPTPPDEPCQSLEDVTRQRINQITERVVPPLGMPLPYCDQFFTDFPCVWSPVCLCIPRGTRSYGALPTSVRPTGGQGCGSDTQQDDPHAAYSEDSQMPARSAPCRQLFDMTLEAIKGSLISEVPLMAAALPNCRDDGYFDAIQCMGSMCMCVSELGQPTGKMTQLWKVETLRCG